MCNLHGLSVTCATYMHHATCKNDYDDDDKDDDDGDVDNDENDG